MSDCGKSTNGDTVREQAQAIVNRLPADASWDDLMYQIYVRQAIKSGLADSEAGRTVDVREVRARFDLTDSLRTT